MVLPQRRRSDLEGTTEGLAQAKEALLPRIQAEPTPVTKTPATRVFVEDDALFAIHLRPWRLPGVSEWSGRNDVIMALAEAPADMRALMLARGLSIVLTSEMLMTDVGAEFDDWTWTFSAAQGQVNLRGVGSVTPHGREAFDAAQTPTALLGTKPPDAPVTASIRLDLDGALGAVEPPAALESFRRPSQVAQAFQECGPGCQVHALTPVPLQSTKIAAGLAVDEGMPVAGITVAQAVLTS